MNRQHVIVRVAVLAALCVGAYFLGASFMVKTLAQSDVNIKPFTLEQLFVTYVNSESPGELSEKRTVARRANGDEATISVFVKKPRHGIFRKIQHADGDVATSFDAIGARMSGKVATEQVAARKFALKNPIADCAFPNEQKMGSESVLGIDALRVRREQGPDQRLTEWRALEFACFPLRALIERRDEHGNWVKRLEGMPTVIARGEPEAAYFSADESYKEMKPSELRRQFMRHLGVDEDTCPDCFKGNWDQEADIAYLKKRQ